MRGVPPLARTASPSHAASFALIGGVQSAFLIRLAEADAFRQIRKLEKRDDIIWNTPLTITSDEGPYEIKGPKEALDFSNMPGPSMAARCTKRPRVPVLTPCNQMKIPRNPDAPSLEPP